MEKQKRLMTIFLFLLVWMGIVLTICVTVGSLTVKFRYGSASSTIRILELTKSEASTDKELPACNTTAFGALKNGTTVWVNTTAPTWAYLNENTHPNLPGGHYRPTSCKPEVKVAIIIPYRNREQQLRGFLQHMIPFLLRQLVEFKIFVIELVPNVAFNRAILMNIGFLEVLKSDNFSCFVFHDVDLLPEDIRNLYMCRKMPVHLSQLYSTFNYKPLYGGFFGGVSALTKDQFEKVNGYSNVYFGWGAEDDDFSARITHHKLGKYRQPMVITKYKMWKHKEEYKSPHRIKWLQSAWKRFDKDGLNSVKYDVIKREDRVLFTWVLVSVNQTEIMSKWTTDKPKVPVTPVPTPKNITKKA